MNYYIDLLLTKLEYEQNIKMFEGFIGSFIYNNKLTNNDKKILNAIYTIMVQELGVEKLFLNDYIINIVKLITKIDINSINAIVYKLSGENYFEIAFNRYGFDYTHRKVCIKNLNLRKIGGIE